MRRTGRRLEMDRSKRISDSCLANFPMELRMTHSAHGGNGITAPSCARCRALTVCSQSPRWPRCWNNSHAAMSPRGRCGEPFSEARNALIADRSAPTDPEALARSAAQSLSPLVHPSLRRVINATGVVVHTNLGRAPVSDAAERAMARRGVGLLQSRVRR